MFLLLNKNNYVEIALSQIEKKHASITFKQLQEIRINSASKNRHNSQSVDDFASYHVLDEVMENVNMWVKALPLGDDEDSWLNHSPNVMAARRCALFVKQEYKRGIVDFETLLKEGISVERS